MMFRLAGITLVALLAGILTSGAAADQVVPLYGTEGIVLRSSMAYDGLHGEPNPFDLELVAQVVSPSGKRYSIPGFFDGDGEGGPAGRVFRIRVCPDEPGTWSWSVSGNVPGLSPGSGSFVAKGTLPGFFGKGPIGTSPDQPRVFPAAGGRTGVPGRQVPRLNLRGATGPFKVEWYDPRNGTFRPAPPVQGGQIRTFDPPSQEDWVLYIHK